MSETYRNTKPTNEQLNKRDQIKIDQQKARDAIKHARSPATKRAEYELKRLGRDPAEATATAAPTPEAARTPAKPEPPQFTSTRDKDDAGSGTRSILAKIRSLESMVKRQQAEISKLTRRGMMIVKPDGTTGWKQQAITSAGGLTELTGGLAAVDGDDAEMLDIATMADAEGAYFLAPFRATVGGNVIWRYVKIAGGGILHVTLATDGGTAGDATTAASFTYAVTNQSGDSIGTGVSPTQNRPVGLTTAALTGLARMDGEDCILIWCDEVPSTGECPGA